MQQSNGHMHAKADPEAAAQRTAQQKTRKKTAAMSLASISVALTLLIAHASCQAAPAAVVVVNETVNLGTSAFTVVKETYARWPAWTAADCPRAVRMLNLHLNEITSIRAARLVFAQEPCGGHLVWVARPGGNVRNWDWTMPDGARFSVDPNRIFTALQIQKETGAGTLASQQLTQLTNVLLRAYEYDTTEVVIALHNTLGGYGVNDYFPGAASAAQAVDYKVQGGTSPHLYLTQRSTFDAILASGLLVSLVLQTPNIEAVLQQTNAANQGSMSLFARDKVYLNTETFHGELYLQFLHIKTVVDVVVLGRATRALPQAQLEPGVTYCYETKAGRTGKCVATGSKCVGDVKTAQVGCGAGQSCCVSGGCTVVAGATATPGQCMADVDCPSGRGTPSSQGAIGCEQDAVAVKCCTSVVYAPVPPVVKTATPPAPTTAAAGTNAAGSSAAGSNAAPFTPAPVSRTLDVIVDPATSATSAAAVATVAAAQFWLLLISLI